VKGLAFIIIGSAIVNSVIKPDLTSGLIGIVGMVVIMIGCLMEDY